MFAVSEDVKAHLVGEGFGARQVGVIYNGIDVGPLPTADLRAEIRRRLEVGDAEFVIGTIARLDPVKDLGTLLRATATLVQRISATLVVVGDGSERHALEALALELGIAPRVRFLGQRNDARDWLAGCDAYVNSSISEGVSLTILEAMAAAPAGGRDAGWRHARGGGRNMRPAGRESRRRVAGSDPARAR